MLSSRSVPHLPSPFPPGRHQSAFQQMPMYHMTHSEILQVDILTPEFCYSCNHIMSNNTCHQTWPCYLSNAAQHISSCRYVILLCTVQLILCHILLFWYVLHRSQFINLQVINVKTTQDVTVATVDLFFFWWLILGY